MYYKFNGLTSRIIATTQMQAYSPQGLIPFSKVKIIPVSMSYQPATVTQVEGIPQPVERLPPGPTIGTKAREVHVAAVAQRVGSPGGIKYSPVPEQLKAAQKHFQKNDGLPVHLKGGPMDNMLYMLTMGLCVVGTAWSLVMFGQMSFPKAPEE